MRKSIRHLSVWLTALAVLAPMGDAAFAKGRKKHVKSAEEEALEAAAAPPMVEPVPVPTGKPYVRLRTIDPQILGTTEMLGAGEKLTGDIAAAVQDGERLRENVARERDHIKLSCIQTKLSQMKLSMQLADERLDVLRKVSRSGDELSIRHEYRNVELAHERALTLRREMVDCSGEDLQENGTRVNVVDPTGNDNTSIDDPSRVTPMPAPLDRPTNATPYN